jgi:hypothetical protein
MQLTDFADMEVYQTAYKNLVVTMKNYKVGLAENEADVLYQFNKSLPSAWSMHVHLVKIHMMSFSAALAYYLKVAQEDSKLPGSLNRAGTKNSRDVIHSTTDLNSKTDIQNSQSKEVCRLFARGKCKYGSSCRYSHSGSQPPSHPPRRDKSNQLCTHCNKKGHLIGDCFRKKREDRKNKNPATVNNTVPAQVPIVPPSQPVLNITQAPAHVSIDNIAYSTVAPVAVDVVPSTLIVDDHLYPVTVKSFAKLSLSAGDADSKPEDTREEQATSLARRQLAARAASLPAPTSVDFSFSDSDSDSVVESFDAVATAPADVHPVCYASAYAYSCVATDTSSVQSTHGRILPMVLDGASTVAVVQDPALCTDIRPVDLYIKTGGEGKPNLVHCAQVGTLSIDMVTSGHRLKLTLEARIIPGFGVDILPECVFLERNFAVNKSGRRVVVTNPSGQTILRGEAHRHQSNWLFFCDMTISTSSRNSVAKTDDVASAAGLSRTTVSSSSACVHSITDVEAMSLISHELHALPAERDLHRLLPFNDLYEHVYKVSTDLKFDQHLRNNVNYSIVKGRLSHNDALLKWHLRLGHRNFRDVASQLGIPLPSPRTRCGL